MAAEVDYSADPYYQPYNQLTAGQLASGIGFLALTAWWIRAELFSYLKKQQKGSSTLSNGDIEAVTKEYSKEVTKHDPTDTSLVDWEQVRFYTRVFQCDPDALTSCLPTLRAMMEFSIIMIWYFVCDRTSVFPTGIKSYSRDLFAFIYGCFILVGFWTSSKENAPGNTSYLNRDMTEEWKGWMQVLFVMYHYFEASEQYNSIRLYIAGYVWMTGFGNFSYYYIRQNFSLSRFFQMLWRLNFLSIVCCVVLNNSWMLYYICPMHTLWTLFVYVTLLIRHRFNQESNVFLIGKVIAATIVTAVIYEIPGVFNFLWAPFEWMVEYQDPRKGPSDKLWEWHFRSGLDRYIWIIGMIYAFCHPPIDKLIKSVDEMPIGKRWMIRSATVAVITGVMAWYIPNVFLLDKYSYNALHPFTSWIPLTGYVALRNLTPWLRARHVGLLSWLGKITLETYISQFHIWLRTGGSNAQPKYLLELLPGYPLLNFALCTAVYILVSYRLFNLTGTLKNAMIPNDNTRRMATNFLVWACFSFILYVVACMLMLHDSVKSHLGLT